MLVFTGSQDILQCLMQSYTMNNYTTSHISMSARKTTVLNCLKIQLHFTYKYRIYFNTLNCLVMQVKGTVLYYVQNLTIPISFTQEKFYHQWPRHSWYEMLTPHTVVRNTFTGTTCIPVQPVLQNVKYKKKYHNTVLLLNLYVSIQQLYYAFLYSCPLVFFAEIQIVLERQ